MQTSTKSYLPEELCKAPDYHLAENYPKDLPEVEIGSTKSKYLDSLAPISAVQVFEDIPGIKKSTFSFDTETETSFEVWTILPNRVLLPEDLEFLKQDKHRVELIAKQLVGIGNSWLNSRIFDKKIKVQSWEDILSILDKYEYAYDLIDIIEVPYKISKTNLQNESSEKAKYWSISPPSWNISLKKTRSFNGCYIVDDYNSSYNFSIEVWIGIPFLKNIQTGEVITRENFQ
ncbi:hypothetical protein NDI44_07705 [Trichocoleus sp. DQ-A3]|uniref:hypothetical protein n=1 Tax=Cyanophyceae TaxID=3028117 RepID=UPI001689318B|nr:hypothetical protein [Coleofasciculus sp. FACHB-125]MBD1899074.1 hypothetical protein [Coleofasciculus sp. FACHB-125]